MCRTTKCGVYQITVVSFTLSAFSVTVLALAVATDSWLHMREKLKINLPPEMEGMEIQMNDTWTIVWSGLWNLCMETEDSNYDDDDNDYMSTTKTMTTTITTMMMMTTTMMMMTMTTTTMMTMASLE
nr:hypothetical protein BaRGS_006703 [Batillaria attramentaria]